MRTSQALTYREAQVFRRLVHSRLWFREETRRWRRLARTFTRAAPWFRLALALYHLLTTTVESPVERHGRLMGGRPPQIL